MTEALHRTVRLVAVLNLAYFGVEFAVALAIGSVSLFADSVDFLEDASVNLLILAGLGWTARNRARLGMALAAILLIPGFAALWTAWEKFNTPVAPDPLPLSLAGLGGAGGQPVLCVHAGALSAAQRKSNESGVSLGPERCLANVAIIAAGLVTASL